MTDELTRRNTVAFQQAIEELRSIASAQHDQLQHLRATVTTLLQRITQLEQLVTAQTAKTFGHGPSVKGDG